MPLLSDEPSTSRSETGEGEKFVQFFRDLDPDDQKLIRKWVEVDRVDAVEVWQRLIRDVADFPVSKATTRRGLQRLKAAEWEC